ELRDPARHARADVHAVGGDLALHGKRRRPGGEPQHRRERDDGNPADDQPKVLLHELHQGCSPVGVRQSRRSPAPRRGSTSRPTVERVPIESKSAASHASALLRPTDFRYSRNSSSPLILLATPSSAISASAAIIWR